MKLVRDVNMECGVEPPHSILPIAYVANSLRFWTEPTYVGCYGIDFLTGGCFTSSDERMDADISGDGR